jgi:8-amino-7-oxononanoate synthase
MSSATGDTGRGAPPTADPGNHTGPAHAERTDMIAALQSDLDTLAKAGLLRRMRTVHSRRGVGLNVSAGNFAAAVIDFSANDYLGLASDPRIARAAATAAEEHAIGAAAARLVSGNHPLHEELEGALARFKGAEAALLYPTGYSANIGAIPALVGRRDVIYADELNHASLIDACRISRAELRVVPHCDTGVLQRMLAEDAGKFRRRLIVVDGVFSMDGDLYPLPELVRIARDANAWTYVDDAHGTGVLGAHGRGAAEHWEVEGELDVLMGTLGKAIGVSGAFITGSRVLVDFLINRSRSFVFTPGTPPMLAAATLEALRIAKAEGWRRDRLRENATRLREGVRGLGFTPAGESDGHIVPVVLGSVEKTMHAGAALLERGYLVGSIRPPTVPIGGARLRITVSAAHEQGHVDGLLAALAEALASYGPDDRS